MLIVKPASLGEKASAAPVDIAATTEPDCCSHDMSVKVTALHSHRALFRQDGAASLGLVQIVTAAEPAARTFEINGPLTAPWSASSGGTGAYVSGSDSLLPTSGFKPQHAA